MAVKANPDIIREMEREISSSVRKLEDIIRITREGASAASRNWNDEQAEAYLSIMERIARNCESSRETLRRTAPKLEQLASSLDAYLNIRF